MESTYKVIWRPDIEELREVSTNLVELDTYSDLIKKYGPKTIEGLEILIKEGEKQKERIETETNQKLVAGPVKPN